MAPAVRAAYAWHNLFRTCCKRWPQSPTGHAMSATVNSTTNGMVTGAASRKRHTSSDKRTLQALSDRWTSRSHGRGQLRVIDAIYSHIHPDDGLAFRTNIHSDNATLFVHTNGKNATAQFDDDSRMNSRNEAHLIRLATISASRVPRV